MGGRAREGRGAVLSVVVCWVTDMKETCRRRRVDCGRRQTREEGEGGYPELADLEMRTEHIEFF